MTQSYQFSIRRRVTLGVGIAMTALLAGPSAQAEEFRPWPVLHHDAQVDLRIEGARLQVVDRLGMAPAPAAQAPLRFLLHRELEIESVELEGTPLHVESRDGFQPRHFWARPDYAKLEAFAVAREHTIEPPSGGWPPAPRLTIAYSGAVYDSLRPPDVAYGRGFESTSGLIDPRGAYLSSESFWLPWVGEELFSFELRVESPPAWRSVSQGRLLDHRELDGGRRIDVWRSDDPMEEAYLIAGPFVVRERVHGSVTAYTFTYENTPEDLCATYLDATGDYLDMYEEMIGRYPFSKFAMVENWWQTGYGMPSFTLLGDRVIRLPFIVHTSYGHEILHNWWGNGVFVDYDAGNWCEGLTTYLADYWYKEQESAAAARDYRLGQLRGYLDFAGTGGRDFSLRSFTEREDAASQAVGYGKTMMVFHMARKKLGDTRFFAALKHLYTTQRFRLTSWDDVIRAFEESTSETLAPWFEQWIGRAGAPRVSLVQEGRDAKGIRVTILQEEPLYALELSVQASVAGEARARTVVVDGARTTIQLESGTNWMALDPDFDVFRRLERAEIPPTFSQTQGADSTLVIIGEDCSVEMAEAFRALGEEWARNQNMLVVDAGAVTPEQQRGRHIYLFGSGERAERAFAEVNSFGTQPDRLRGRAEAEALSLVVAFRDSRDDELSTTVLLAAEAGVVAALGRKLPHYSRYSYLLFAGETNVDKGNWTVESSPLRIDFTEASP